MERPSNTIPLATLLLSGVVLLGWLGATRQQVSAQYSNSPFNSGTSVPSGPCSSNTGRLVGPAGTIYTCQSGTWAQASGSGGATGPTGPQGPTGATGPATLGPIIQKSSNYAITCGDFTALTNFQAVASITFTIPTGCTTGLVTVTVGTGFSAAFNLSTNTVTANGQSTLTTLAAGSGTAGYGGYALLPNPALSTDYVVRDMIGATGPTGSQGVTGATGPTGGGTVTVASGTSAMGTGTISSGACATVVTTTATGVATTDDIIADFNADPTSTTGYSPSANGMLTIIKYPTSGNVNFKVCNNTAASITPGAVTLNWRVVR